MAQTYPIRRLFSLKEYLMLERRAQTRSEYWRGEIYATAGGSPTHSLISANVTIALCVSLRGRSDLRV